MAVYVDPLLEWDMTNKPERIARHGNLWCHLLADSEDELVAFATALGLPAQAIQRHPRKKWRTHFDLPPSYRAAAVNAGAVDLTWDEFLGWIAVRRSPEADLSHR